MHVLIATDGLVDTATAAELAVRLAGDEGRVTVFTAVEVPRRLLGQLSGTYSKAEVVIIDGESVDVRSTGTSEQHGWPGDDAVIGRYLDDQRQERTDDLAAALRSRGTDPAIEVRECEQVHTTILNTAAELGADVICIGSHGRGLFEGFLGSTGTKVIRLAKCPVLVIRNRS